LRRDRARLEYGLPVFRLVFFNVAQRGPHQPGILLHLRQTVGAFHQQYRHPFDDFDHDRFAVVGFQIVVRIDAARQQIGPRLRKRVLQHDVVRFTRLQRGHHVFRLLHIVDEPRDRAAGGLPRRVVVHFAGDGYRPIDPHDRVVRPQACNRQVGGFAMPIAGLDDFECGRHAGTVESRFETEPPGGIVGAPVFALAVGQQNHPPAGDPLVFDFRLH
jgi:hypothetical protein